MKKLSFILILLSGLAIGARSSHALTVSLSPTVQNVSRGQLFSELLSISDFSPNLIGAFSLDVAFNPALLTFTSASFFGGLGNPNPAAFETITFTDGSLPGIASLGEVSLLSGAELANLQIGSLLPLAILNFNAGNTIGNTALQLQNVVVSDANGNPLSALIGPASNVNVNAVPEPSTAFLLIFGLVVLVMSSRRAVL